MKTQTQEQIKFTEEVAQSRTELRILNCILKFDVESIKKGIPIKQISALTGERFCYLKQILESFHKREICFYSRHELVILDRGYYFLHPELVNEVETPNQK